MRKLGARSAPPPRLAAAVRAVKLLALAVLLGGAVVLPLSPSAVPGGRGGPDPVRRTTAVERVVDDTALGSCADHGLVRARTATTDDVVVALVRSARGVVRQVPFEQGWQVFRGERPGTLVAVCRDARS